jgi:antitoxin VapB
MQTAKIFKNGRSQAVRLPKDFRLKGESVAVFHLGEAIILQPIHETWMDVCHAMHETDDFFAEPREDLPPEERELF